MLNLLGTIGGNVLSLPGILGVALGMMTRNVYVAALMGGAVGVIESLVFAKWTIADVGNLELIVAIAVGILAGMLGCWIRHKGTVAA